MGEADLSSRIDDALQKEEGEEKETESTKDILEDGLTPAELKIFRVKLPATIPRFFRRSKQTNAFWIQEYDKDKSGKLTKEEFAKLLKDLHEVRGLLK